MAGLHSATMQPRVGRQATVSVICQKKSFTRKVVETTGTFCATAGLIASQTLAFNPAPQHQQLLLDRTRDGLYYELATGPKQEAYQKKIQEIQDKKNGPLLADPEVQKMIQISNDNAKEFERYRILQSYANFERTQQATPEGTCKFPTNFLGCDGKFAQSKWIKEKRALDCKYAKPGECIDAPTIGLLTPGTKKME